MAIETVGKLGVVVAGMLIAVLFVLIIWYLVQIYRIERHLERAHPDLFAALGEPHLIWNNSIRNNFRFGGFLLKKQYEDLGDTHLSAVAGTCRLLFIVDSALFVFILIGLLGGLWLAG